MRKIILYITGILLITSCDKQLDVPPTTAIDNEAAKKNIDLLVTGAFSMIGSGGPSGLEGGLYSTDLLLDADLLASEDYMQWRGTFNQYNEISNKAMSSTNSSVTRIWRKGYAAINLANVILKNIDNAKEDDRDVFRGEALFIRGIMHFELLRFFKDPAQNLGVPVMTEATEDFTQIQFPERETIDNTYAAIIADLEEAKSLLPDDYDVYADRYVAAAFLARVYLDKGDYAEALAEADEVIESGKYDLPASVEEAFNNNESPESIFEIQQTTQNNSGTANDGLTTFYACDPDTPGSASRGDVQIEDSFIAEYEPGDKRSDLLIYEGTCNKASITSGKWKDPYTNIPVIRLSEMYLIRAECNIRLGNAGAPGETPTEDVNKIRIKAGASTYGSVTLDDVLMERQLELAFEGQRIHDLRRLGVTDPVDYNGPEFTFPIPQTEINTNPNLKQNLYYQ
jgi:tetratricopeptide (TPR) repeat protein